MKLPAKLCLAVALSGLFAAPAAAQPKPNIVVVMVDDLDLSVFDTMLKPEYNLLPGIQNRLVNQGTNFTQMFVTQPLCCPSRATFQTGQYPQNHGIVGNDVEYYRGIKGTPRPRGYRDLREPTALATWLNKDGNASGAYRTGFFGKYLNGSGQGEDMTRQPAGWETWRALVPIVDNTDPRGERAVQCMYGFALANSGGAPEVFGGAPLPRDPSLYQTKVLGDKAVEFIGNSDTRPFFLVVTPTAPHNEGCKTNQYPDPAYNVRTSDFYLRPENLTPWIATLPATRQADSYDERLAGDKPKWIRLQDIDEGLDTTLLDARTKSFNDKVAAMRPVDDLVSRLLNALVDTKYPDGTPKLNHTLFIFTSDNGYQFGTHRQDGKQDFYEESIRVPMIIRAPGQRKASTVDAWALNNDWAVTIADYAGVTPYHNVDAPRPVADGRSLKPLIEGQAGTRKTFLIRTGPNPGDPPPLKSARAGASPEDDEGAHVPYIALRTYHKGLTGDDDENTILVYAESTHEVHGFFRELYDVTPGKDPDQSQNLVGRAAWSGKIPALSTRLHKLKNCSGLTGVDSCGWLEDN